MTWKNEKFRHSLSSKRIKSKGYNHTEYMRKYRLEHPEVKKKEREYAINYYNEHKDSINTKKRIYRRTESYKKWKENYKKTEQYKELLKRRYETVRTKRELQNAINNLNKYEEKIKKIMDKYNVDNDTAELVFQLRKELKYMDRQEMLDFTEEILETEGIDFLNMIFLR